MFENKHPREENEIKKKEEKTRVGHHFKSIPFNWWFNISFSLNQARFKLIPSEEEEMVGWKM